MACLESVDKMLFVQDCGHNIVLCHFPMAEWNGYYRGAWHIYGHIHSRMDAAGQYMRGQERARNAGCMCHDYQPVTFQELADSHQVIRGSERR